MTDKYKRLTDARQRLERINMMNVANISEEKRHEIEKESHLANVEFRAAHVAVYGW